METTGATDQTLAEYMTATRPEGFHAEASYFADGDYVTYFLKNDLYYAERTDDFLTVYRSEKDGEVMGCKIKGVRNLVEMMGDLALIVTVDSVKMGPLLLTAAMVSREDNRHMYMNLAKNMGSMNLPSLARAA